MKTRLLRASNLLIKSEMENHLDKLSNIMKCMQKCLECAICLETLSHPVQTRCGHLFCNNCIVAVAMKKGAVCPLCKEPISRRSISIDTQTKELSAGFEALFDAIQADTGIDIRTYVSKPGNGREGIPTPCKSNILERKNMKMNASKLHLPRNKKENQSAAGCIDLNYSAKPIKDFQNCQRNTRLESSNDRDVDLENENKNSNFASISYTEMLRGIDHTRETESGEKVAAWLKSIKGGEELETMETKHNGRRNTNMPSKRCLLYGTDTLDELNIEGSSCKSNISKITSDENKVLSLSCAEPKENCRKINKLLAVTTKPMDRALKPSSKASGVISRKTSEIGADKFTHENLKYKGVHLRVQEIRKKLLYTSESDSWSRVMQFGNPHNTVNTTLSSCISANNQRLRKGTLAKPKDTTVSEDTEENNAIDGVSNLKSSDRNSPNDDGSTEIMSNISSTPFVSPDGTGNTSSHSVTKTNINNNRGIDIFEDMTSELRVMPPSNSCVNQCEVTATQNYQHIDPDHETHNDNVIQRRKDIECVSTNNIIPTKAYANASNVSNEIPLLSPIPNFREQLTRHFASPNHIESGEQQKYKCTSQNGTLSPPKLTPVKGRCLSQQINLNGAKNNSDESLVQYNGSPFSSSFPNFRNKLYQKRTLHASNSPHISKNVKLSISMPQISADLRKTINSVVNFEDAGTLGKCEHDDSNSFRYSKKNETISNPKFKEKLKSKRLTTQQSANVIQKFNKKIQFLYMGRINSGMLKGQTRTFNDVAIQNETITHNRHVQTYLVMPDINIIEEQKLIIEKQRSTIEEQRLIMVKQERTIKKQEIMIKDQKLTTKEHEQTIAKRDFSLRNVEYCHKSVNGTNLIPLEASSMLLKAGTTTTEIFGQNDIEKQNSSARTSTNTKSINAGLQSQSRLNNLESENQRDNKYIEQKVSVPETKNGNASNILNCQEQRRQICSTGICYDSEKRIRKEQRVEKTPEKNIEVKHNDLSCNSPRTKQLEDERSSNTAIYEKNVPRNTKLSYTTDYLTSVEESISQKSRGTNKRTIAQDSPDVGSDLLLVSLPSKDSGGVETCSKSYISLKSEKTLKNNLSDVVTDHKERSAVDRKRSTSSLINDDVNVDVIMNDWCSGSKLTRLSNQENSSNNRKAVTNIISRNIKKIERSIDIAWQKTKMCEVDVVNADRCHEGQTSFLTNKKNISTSNFTGFDEQHTSKADGSCDEVRTRKRKLRETEGCVDTQDVKERFYNTIVTKVRRIQNDLVMPEKDLNPCEVTPTKNIIVLDLTRSEVKNVERVADNGTLLSDKVTANVMSNKDQITDYQSHGKIDTQDRMAMEDNFNEAMANVDSQVLAGLTIEGEYEQSTHPKINKTDEANVLESCQSSNTALDSQDAIERESPTSIKPDHTKLYVDASMKSASKKFKEFFNLSQFSNNSNKENCNVNVTQDRISSTLEHNSILQNGSSQQRLVPSRLKSNRMKAQDAHNKTLKTVVHDNVVCIDGNSSTAYQFEEKNTKNKNVCNEKTSMENPDKGVYDESLHESHFCDRDSSMNVAEEMILFKNTDDELFDKNKLKVVRTPAVEEVKSENAAMKKIKSVLEHSCNKDYNIPYSEDDVVEKTPEKKLEVTPHAPNTKFRESWKSLNLTPIPKIMKKPSIATPSMNCSKDEQPVASYSNTVSAYSSKVLETPNRDRKLFMLYESTPKISHTARNSWVVPEARLKERKFQLNLSTTATSTCAKSQMHKLKSKLCFLCTTLSAEQIKNVQRFAKLVNAEFTTTFRPEVTHVIVVTDSENNSVPRTLKYLQAIAHRKWVVSYSWVLDSLKRGTLLDEEKYEPVDVFSSEPASKKARLHQGVLFEGFAFLCIGPFRGATVENYEDLVRATGGYVVQTLDALAASNHQWKFIIIPDVIHDNELIGWYQRTKAVPVLNEWLLECISQYALISLHSFIRELTPQDLLKLGFPLELVEPEESDMTNDASP